MKIQLLINEEFLVSTQEGSCCQFQIYDERALPIGFG